MEQAGDRLFIYHTDPGIDALLSGETANSTCSFHFSHNEEFFVCLQDDISVPSFTIHHDVQQKKPGSELRESYVGLTRQINKLLPGLLQGFRFFFDASDTLKLSFFQLLKVEDAVYLLLLRIDLGYKPSAATLIGNGSNDRTPEYRTRKLYMDLDVIPVRDIVNLPGGPMQMQVIQTVSETWVGETGRGYFIQGIWLDREITKFFTRLFVPTGKKMYPYYPLNCKFRAICFQPFNLDIEGRRKAVSALHHCRAFLEKNVKEIESVLHSNTFSEDLPLFKKLRAQINPAILLLFEPLKLRAYLNQNDMKEYELTYEAK